MARYDGMQALRVEVEQRVAWVTIDHPPINLFDLTLFLDLGRLVPLLEDDPDVQVIVFRSADPEFFIAHADVGWILTLPETKPAPLTELGPFVALMERLRRMPKVSIGAIAGIARGGGSELLLSLDMRFAALGRAVLAQPEVALGIIPGGSGTQRLPRLVGRARALEIILGCDDVPADLAEQWGYVNRALPPAALGPFVDRLAARIASFPAGAIALAKAAVDAADTTVVDGLLAEADAFNQSLALPETQARMQRFMQAGGQTVEVEKRLDAAVEKLRE